MWHAKNLGRIKYQEALDYQLYLADLKQKGLKDDYFLMLEHDDVFTMGKGANKDNILDKNIPVIITNRGGDVTYHGPGQLMGYFIMNLRVKNYGINGYLRKIEELIIKVLSKIEIKAYRIDGLTGVWAENKKIASIGIAVKKGVTLHGFALNISPDLSQFYKINPCGLNSELISSIKELKKNHISIKYIQTLLLEVFSEVFGEAVYMIYDDIEKAIKLSKIVFFDYYSEAKGFSCRTGEPYEVKYTETSNKLYLWDYSTNQIRAFIIDNMSNFTVTTESFMPRSILKS